jgi:hypothetical protein
VIGFIFAWFWFSWLAATSEGETEHHYQSSSSKDGDLADASVQKALRPLLRADAGNQPCPNPSARRRISGKIIGGGCGSEIGDWDEAEAHGAATVSRPQP